MSVNTAVNFRPISYEFAHIPEYTWICFEFISCAYEKISTHDK